jgi:hypothetical protein
VDTGFASPEKRYFDKEICPDNDARTSDGPGVFTSGEPTPPTKSAGALRRAGGTPRSPFAAVPL